MKRILIGALAAALILMLTACGKSEGGVPKSETNDSLPPVRQQDQASAPDRPATPEEAGPQTPISDETAITLTVGDQTFSATLLENESARQLAAMFPMTLDMSELNGNEKYFYLDGSLPTDSQQPGQIKAGDLMLYGNNCLVLFYETFSSSYSYTRLGRVDDPAGLAEALGAGSVSVSFSNASAITTWEPGFFSASFSGNDGFDAFLAQGGASSDSEVTRFLAAELSANTVMHSDSFGCSTLAVSSPDGHALFGRNFDWENCEALVVSSKPANGYASISTVNLGFISQTGGSLGGLLAQNDVRILAALYAPLDGMNEKGLAVSVNMIQESASISQNTGLPDLTTTTAVRLLLNKAADVDEALTLLQRYDLHGSMGMMVHFALADTTGRAVVVEYIDNEMIVTETPVVTNFYLAEGTKQGIGTQQSHERYDILTQALAEHSVMSMNEVRDALDSVSKDNFNEFESTEWSAVFDLSAGEAHYYHRENYDNCYTFSVG